MYYKGQFSSSSSFPYCEDAQISQWEKIKEIINLTLLPSLQETIVSSTGYKKSINYLSYTGPLVFLFKAYCDALKQIIHS